MATEIKVPSLGESITEATVSKWFKKPGEPVAGLFQLSVSHPLPVAYNSDCFGANVSLISYSILK